MRETETQFAIREACARAGQPLWRNNTGKFWAIPARASCKACGANLRSGQGIEHAYIVPCGLGVGGPDLVGVETGTGRFLGLEVKTETGRVRPEQALWHTAAAARGARIVVVRSVEDALASLQTSALRGDS